VNGQLYLGARGLPTPELPAGKGGSVLHWIGDRNNPFKYEEVGTLPNESGYITNFGDQLVVTGWNAVIGGEGALTAGPAKLWISRHITPSTPLTPADKGLGNPSWKPFFSYSDYDPDPLRGQSGFWGAAKEYNGKLYVGTYAYPSLMSATFFHNYYPKLYGERYGYAKRQDLGKVPDIVKTRDARNSDTAIKVFEFSNPGTSQQQVRLVVGDYKLPVFDPDRNTWVMKRNKLGARPTSGLGNGYNERFNYYSWTWTILKGKLYMGTADLCEPGSAFLPGVGNQIFRYRPLYLRTVVAALDLLSPRCQGGDLWRMDSPTKIVAEDVHGYGNKFTWGIRGIVNFGDKMYAAGATGFDLKTGWRLVKMTPQDTPVRRRIRPNSQVKPVYPAQLALNILAKIRLGVGARAAQQRQRVTVGQGQPVDFTARLRNTGNGAVRSLRLCVRVPVGFRLSGNPGATVSGRQGCFRVARLAENAARTVRLHANAGQRVGNAVAIASVYEGTLGCAGGAVPVAEAASVRAAQNARKACISVATSAQALPVRVRRGTAQGGGVTG
jgi:hypothetical protein